MGERVVVNPAGAEPQPRRVVPLGYGQGDSWLARMGRYWGPFGTGVDQFVRRGVGGWRRVGFAFGMSFTFGGLTLGMADRNFESAAIWAGIGGMLIGLTVPIRGLDEPRS